MERLPLYAEQYPPFSCSVLNNQHRNLYVGNVNFPGISVTLPKRRVTVDVNQSWRCWSPSPVIGFGVGVRLYTGKNLSRFWDPEAIKKICSVWLNQFSLVPHSCPTLQPHGLHHDRLPCPSPTPRTCSNSCASSQWFHPTISPPFSSCLQSFPSSGSFIRSQFFASGGQIIGASASPSVLQMNIRDWIPLGLTGCISLQSKGLSRAFSSTTIQKYEFFNTQLYLWSNSHLHTWLLGKP